MAGKKIVFQAAFQVLTIFAATFAFAFILYSETVVVSAAEDEKGCCYSPNEGVCQSNSAKSACESRGGTWKNEKTCNLVECKPICCNLPTHEDSWFMTENRCRVLSKFYGIPANIVWASEQGCISLQKSIVMGACTYAAGDKTLCKFISRAECSKITNVTANFRENVLCSSPASNASCTRQAKTGCVKGKSEVYWFDSCGNAENIYSSDKNASWNGGNVLGKENSCNPGSANIDSTKCGNCEYGNGSACTEATGTKPEYGGYICGDLNCVEDGKTYTNGESWCYYESYIGDGKDVAGSRYVRKLCNNGRVINEPCADYKQEVCATNTVDGKRNSICRVNQWRDCLNAGDDENICNSVPDCEFRTIPLFDKKDIRLCTPRYPPGLDFSNDEGFTERNNAQCDAASVSCTMTFLCGECVSNCKCLEPYFTQTLNNLCTSIGDCGAKSNIVGSTTDAGYTLRTKGGAPPRLSASDLNALSKYATPVEGQTISWMGNETKIEYVKAPFEDEEEEEEGGKPPPESNVFMDIILTICTCGIYLFFMGGTKDCKPKQYTVEFNCKSWKPPVGGTDCGKCDDKSAAGVPCSKYRCESLGMGCELLNEGTSKELCFWVNKDDKLPPEITLQDLPSDYVFRELTKEKSYITDTKGECLEQLSPARVNLKTNEPALCKYDFEDLSFNESIDYITDGYVYDHTLPFAIPSKSAIKWEAGLLSTDNTTEVDNLLAPLFGGNTTYYVKCQDKNGNEVAHSVSTCVSERDITAPKVLVYSPSQNGSFAYQKNTRDIAIYTDEPTECRWSGENVLYDAMTNQMSCENKFREVTRFGWKCNATVQKTADMKYYIKCKDQPWLANTARSGERNVNTESFIMSFKESPSALSITDITPSGVVKVAVDPTNFTLKITTAGGSDGGKATCEIRAPGENFKKFGITDAKTHVNNFGSLSSGGYSVDLKCTDSAENIAQGAANFILELDTSGPTISRIMQRSSQVQVRTSEEATCKFSYSSCEFDFNNATIAGKTTKEHTMPFLKSKTYYLVCKDSFGNGPPYGSCSAVIRPV